MSVWCELDLRGIHFLLTYKCNLECDHCFVWGSPDSEGVFNLKQIAEILGEAKRLDSVRSISVEGGEPFLYYPIMIKTLELAAKNGFHVELLTNSYWATTYEDALEWLQPIANIKDIELTLSSDLYHSQTWQPESVKNAARAARTLGIRTSVLATKHPSSKEPCPSEIEAVRVGIWETMYRGRASCKLVDQTVRKSWSEFSKCPYENFSDQKRVHVDPFGYVHVCQGISIGNAWKKPFSEIIRDYDHHMNPILESLIQGGPVALAQEFQLPHDELYADACHFCYALRRSLRHKFPEVLAPDQMYGSSNGLSNRSKAVDVP